MSGAEKLFDAVTEIRDDLIEEAQSHVFPKHKRTIPYRRLAAMAACLAVVLGLTAAIRSGVFYMGSPSSDGVDSNGAGWTGGDSGSNWTGGDNENASTGESSPPEDAEAITFTAVVAEVHDAYLVVEPPEGEELLLSTANRIEVPTGDLEELPALQVGDTVEITCTGEVMETYPARLTEVLSIEVLEPAP